MNAARPLRRIAVALTTAIVGACTGTSMPTRDGALVDAPIAASGSCRPDAAAPQMVRANPAVLPASVFDRASGWEARLSFRIDPRGAPIDIRTTVGEGTADADVIVAATGSAFAGYRFCAPAAYASETRWTAALRFRPVLASREARASDASREARASDALRQSPTADAPRSSDLFVQMFVPAYTRDDLVEHRTGKVRVAATFASDGRPSSLRLVESSGDDALDRKSLEAMASWQLVYRPGTAPDRPLVFEQPYVYAIR